MSVIHLVVLLSITAGCCYGGKIRDTVKKFKEVVVDVNMEVSETFSFSRVFSCVRLECRVHKSLT